MRKIFIIIGFLSFSFAAAAQGNASKVSKKNKSTSSNSAQTRADTSSGPVIPTESLTLKETGYDFGKIPQGKPVTHDFEFTNTGDAPLVLDNVRASCGCTTPEWSKAPVAAGATAVIKVGYNAANEGPFTKTVTVMYNGNQSKQIIIRGEVWKTPATSAPVNTSLNTLKNDQ